MNRWLSCCLGFALVLVSARAAAAPDSNGGFRVEAETFAGAGVPENTDKFSSGPQYGLTLLARPAWWTSVGLSARHASYGYHAIGRGGEFEDPNASYEYDTIGLAWRLYATDEGWAEPYFHFFMGRAAVDVSVQSPQCDDGGGPIYELGFGLDAYAWRWLRIGGAFGLGSSPHGSTECNAMYIPTEPPAVPAGPLAVSIRGALTFVIGGPDRGLRLSRRQHTP